MLWYYWLLFISPWNKKNSEIAQEWFITIWKYNITKIILIERGCIIFLFLYSLVKTYFGRSNIWSVLLIVKTKCVACISEILVAWKTFPRYTCCKKQLNEQLQCIYKTLIYNAGRTSIHVWDNFINHETFY